MMQKSSSHYFRVRFCQFETQRETEKMIRMLVLFASIEAHTVPMSKSNLQVLLLREREKLVILQGCQKDYSD